MSHSAITQSMRESAHVLVVAPEIPLDGIPTVLLRKNYIDRLAEAGMTPLIVNAGIARETLKRLYAQASAVMFTGGSDIHPQFYNDPIVSSLSGPFDTARDETELEIMRWVLSDGKAF